jgi:hypothetical protein
MTMEMTSAGPAFCDAAVPVSTKIPVPMIDPTPNAVRLSLPRDRRSVPRSASRRSSATDFFVKMDMAEVGTGNREPGTGTPAKLGSIGATCVRTSCEPGPLPVLTC